MKAFRLQLQVQETNAAAADKESLVYHMGPEAGTVAGATVSEGYLCILHTMYVTLFEHDITYFE